MPYITQAARGTLGVRDPATEGELNYVITRLVDRFLQRYGRGYTTINQLIGVLECAKLELYRRIAAPYEDVKIQENGDVYTVGEDE